jgi:hypothetical protein
MDPERLRPFWRAALGYVGQPTEESGIDLADPAGIRPAIWFQRVPKPKAAKNRVHPDIQAPEPPAPRASRAPEPSRTPSLPCPQASRAPAKPDPNSGQKPQNSQL